MSAPEKASFSSCCRSTGSPVTRTVTSGCAAFDLGDRRVERVERRSGAVDRRVVEDRLHLHDPARAAEIAADAEERAPLHLRRLAVGARRRPSRELREELAASPAAPRSPRRRSRHVAAASAKPRRLGSLASSVEHAARRADALADLGDLLRRQEHAGRSGRNRASRRQARPTRNAPCRRQAAPQARGRRRRPPPRVGASMTATARSSSGKAFLYSVSTWRKGSSAERMSSVLVLMVRPVAA